ncbi:hypothetical protein CBS147352_702 [Aspergillus niger]|nr:hypothetical protein CBS147352_702 [Aspergillus niger]
MFTARKLPMLTGSIYGVTNSRRFYSLAPQGIRESAQSRQLNPHLDKDPDPDPSLQAHPWSSSTSNPDSITPKAWHFVAQSEEKANPVFSKSRLLSLSGDSPLQYRLSRKRHLQVRITQIQSCSTEDVKYMIDTGFPDPDSHARRLNGERPKSGLSSHTYWTRKGLPLDSFANNNALDRRTDGIRHHSRAHTRVHPSPVPL